jgi:mannose-6-phosphate isomerase-like protein (cupin superfamily)
MLLEKSWGLIKEYTLNQVSTVKLIVVTPGKRTSVHFHNLRDDMWVILDDGLEVQVGEERLYPKAGDEFIISAGTPHCLQAGDVPGRVLEIDFGFTAEEDVHYVGEADSGYGSD